MFFKKYGEIKKEKVSNFNNAIKALTNYIYLKDWTSFEIGIKEIKQKETKAFNDYLKILQGDDNLILKEKNKNTANFTEIEKLVTLYKKEKKIYEDDKNLKKAKIRDKNTKKAVEKYVKSGNYEDALLLLNNYLDNNKGIHGAVKYYNKWKAKIFKYIDEDKLKKRKIIHTNTTLEAKALAGEIFNNAKKEEEKKEEEKVKKEKKSIFGFKSFRQKVKEKKILDEIELILEANKSVDEKVIKLKLGSIHKGLVKDISNSNIIGYDFFGKILGCDKISGDTYGLEDLKDSYKFFIGDATGHGPKAGFMVSVLTKKFYELVGKTPLEDLTFDINNSLKQDLTSGNFITSVFFEIQKKDVSKLDYIGMGHEVMLLYKKKTNKIQRIRPGGLAAGIRVMRDKKFLVRKTIDMQDGDILLTYTDGAIETKDSNGEIYGLDRLEDVFFKNASSKSRDSVDIIYNELMKDINKFKGLNGFADDLTYMIFKRNTSKDILTLEDTEKILLNERIEKRKAKLLAGKTKQEVTKKVEKMIKIKKTKRIVKVLHGLYISGEVLELKQECLRFIKEGYLDKKINFYLKKAIDKEEDFRIKQQDKRLHDKYIFLESLYKKGEYAIIIKECHDIISNDGTI